MMVKQLVPQHESGHQKALAVIFDEAVAVKALIQLNLKSWIYSFSIVCVTE